MPSESSVVGLQHDAVALRGGGRRRAAAALRADAPAERRQRAAVPRLGVRHRAAARSARKARGGRDDFGLADGLSTLPLASPWALSATAKGQPSGAQEVTRTVDIVMNGEISKGAPVDVLLGLPHVPPLARPLRVVRPGPPRHGLGSTRCPDGGPAAHVPCPPRQRSDFEQMARYELAGTTPVRVRPPPPPHGGGCPFRGRSAYRTAEAKPRRWHAARPGARGERVAHGLLEGPAA